MRKILIILMALIPMALPGQVLNKGNFLVGSTIGLSTADSKIAQIAGDVDAEGKGPSSVQLSLAPNLGYFLTDEIAVGLGASYTFSSLKEPNEDRTDDSDLLFGPFGRYYYPVDDNMAFFLGADFGFGHSSDQQTGAAGNQSIRTNIFAFGFGPGFTIYADNGIGIEALFKYHYSRSKFHTDMDGVETQTISRTNQFDIALGVQFYFGGVKGVGSGVGARLY